MKKLETLVNRYNKLKDSVEMINTYTSDYKKGFEINVKLHDKFLTEKEIEDCIYQVVLQSYKLNSLPENSEALDAFAILKDEYGSTKVDALFWDWAEVNGDYITDIIDGCRNASWGYWDGVITEVKAGKASGYPYIDRRKTIESKIKELERWKKKDARELRYCGIIKELGYGFYGRQAGHFLVFGVEKVEEMIDSIGELIGMVQADDYTDAMERNQYLKDADSIMKDCEVYVNAIDWILTEVKSIRDGMDFKDELADRVSIDLEENVKPKLLAEFEISEAKRLKTYY